jgi:excisionase family DNA binding protein
MVGSSPQTIASRRSTSQRKAASDTDAEHIPFPRLRPTAPADPRADVSDDQTGRAASGSPPLLSYDDLERLFDRSERSLRRWIAAGHLTAVRVGRSVFFRSEDVERLLSEGRTRAVLRRAGRRATRAGGKSSVLNSKAITHSDQITI